MAARRRIVLGAKSCARHKLFEAVGCLLMIPPSCKRLAEVDFPVAAVSKQAAREKSIRHGHPSTLHLWWARRPLASCRAMLLALLLPDPCDPHCPPDFIRKAGEILLQAPGWNSANRKRDVQTPESLRRALLDFIGLIANWDAANNPDWIRVAQHLVKAAYPAEAPVVVDSFAGGGSIPLEALRLGCEAFASDLNPVACLILKVMLEDIPRHGPGLADELRKAGEEIRKKAEQELADLYPPDPDGSVPIAYLWARTVRCEAPECGAEIPLVRSFWLCKKRGRMWALRPQVVPGCPPEAEFEIFQPKTQSEVHPGTVTRARARCLCCDKSLDADRVRHQLAAQRGGADAIFDHQGQRTGGARLLAVVTLKPGQKGRHYRLPTQRDYQVVHLAQQRLAQTLNSWRQGGCQGLCPVPDEPLPPVGTLGFRVQRYGMLQWGDLFTARQKLALATLSRLIAEATALSEPVREAMAAVLGRCADYWSSSVVWAHTGEFVAGTFGRNALPLVWDCAEAVPWPECSGNLGGAIAWVANAIERIPRLPVGQQALADAAAHPLPDDSATIWFTDPPYYDAIPYADLSDFFFVWFKRALPGHPLLKDPFDPANLLTPKKREAVKDPAKRDNGNVKDRSWFEQTMARAFAEGRRVLREDGVASIVFAHKTTEGWEALLSGMIGGGWTITGSWPVATERPGRLRSQDSAALATSVHLICRPRPQDAPVGDWGQILRELPVRVRSWMQRLEAEGIWGADLVFACIGPALEIFSRYPRVETADGRPVPLDEFLEKVWEVVGRAALEQILGPDQAQSGAGALEEDARLTALFLWTLQSTNGRNGNGHKAGPEAEAPEEIEDEDEGATKKPKGYSLIFDVVRRFAQPFGIDLPRWEGRIIETDKGVVRLLPVPERAGQLFGRDGADDLGGLPDADPRKALQLVLGLDIQQAPQIQARRRSRAPGRAEPEPVQDATTLDHVHAAMILQKAGQTGALRALIQQEISRGPDFLRLANALSALYPRESEEKRLLDAMLLAAPR